MSPQSSSLKVMEKTCFQFAILVFWLSFFTVRNSAMKKINLTTDQSALLAFKSYITDDPYHILANNWSTTTSTCNWIGVSCGFHHQRVVALSLSNMGLSGTIAPHLGNLTFLSSLDVSFNNFGGLIPQQLAHLRQLKIFDFRYNEFRGDVPSWLGSLTEIQHLLLRNNSFSGTIPTSLSNLSKLEILNLRANFLHGYIPEEIGNLSNLRSLDLASNQLTGSIPLAIFNISSFEKLILANNSLYGTLPLNICDHLPKLILLYLSRNQLQGPIPHNLYKCGKLENLALAYNEFSGNIPTEIGNLTMLKGLYLGANKLAGVIPVDICDNLNKIEYFILGWNHLHGTIPPNLYKCMELRYLELGRNEFSGNIPKEIGNMTLLESLILSNNKLTGTLPNEIFNISTMKILDLRSNHFSGYLPSTMGLWLPNLEELYLNHNNLSGTLPNEIWNSFIHLEFFSIGGNSLTGTIPVKIFNISTMKILDLGYNHFSGYLPSSMGLWLPNLKGLYLSNNFLNGIIPRSVGNASKLSLVTMASNLFTGSIPNSFGDLSLLQKLDLADNNLTKESFTPTLRFLSSLTNCKQLEILSISNNKLNGIFTKSFGNFSASLQQVLASNCKIKGNLPIEIGNLSSLMTIHLDGNELTGSIPTTLGRLIRLQRVDFSQNRLQGSIPNELCTLKNMGDLFLNDNEFNGSIPECLGEIKSLSSLYLDSNKLTSTIPSTLWRMTDLLRLNLSSNFLSGNLESDIGSLMDINIIDLSWNQLSGDIPTTIGGAQMLSCLNLSHNNFQGSIPQSMGNLINLEFLDLSVNNFSGVIPKSLEELKYLKSINVSVNKLEGEIPNGGQFANFTAQSYMENDELCGAPRLHVQLCKAKTHRRSITKVVRLLKYILPLITAAMFAGALIYVFTRRTKRRMKLLPHKDSLPLAWRRVSYHELVRATDAFCESNLLGTGSVGSVYKGILSDGMTIAVKVFNLNLEGAFKSFDVECEVMRNIRHRNLVKIISSCTNLDFKALVLTYMPNGNLEKWLYSHNYSLDILTRLNVMIDVATAVEYLHHGYATPIVHRDLKPSNILLDEDMTAHVGDFGISKLLGGKEFIEQTKTLATIGYMAPEYGMDGIVSTSGDVYSYGIVLMETFTRKKPTDELFYGGMSLRSWVLEASYGSIMHIVDSNLREIEDDYLSAKDQCLSSIFALALNCSTNSPMERITMEHAVAKLKKIKRTFLENTGMNS